MSSQTDAQCVRNMYLMAGGFVALFFAILAVAQMAG